MERNAIKVERRCPRCGHRAYMDARLSDGTICCSGGCGHVWAGRFTAEESGAIDMNAEDYEALRYMATYRPGFGYHCTGCKGRFTLAQMRRLAFHGYVTIERPDFKPHTKSRPNRSWHAKITDEGRAEAERYRTKRTG